MTTKHTPGPWFLDGDGGYGELNGFRVRHAAEPEYILAVAIGDVPELELAAQANARLIAAAPDLLAAGKALADVANDKMATVRETVDAARVMYAAIAKAAGA